MKHLKTFLPCIAGGIALLSCTQQELSKGRQILFSVDVFIPEESTKTNCDPTNNYAITWASGDVIGIFPREGYQEPFTIPASQVGNTSASFDGGYWDIKDGLTYNAYYPFDVNNFQSADSKTTIPVVYTGQSQTGTQCNAGAFDYTYSDWTEATGSHVSFNFHHIGSFLVLSLPIPATSTYTKLTLTADSEVIPTAGIYDLTATKPAFVSTTKSTSISMELVDFIGTAGQTAVFYMMMPPCDLSTSTLSAILTASETTCNYSIESKNIVAAKLYKITGEPKSSSIEGTVDGWVQHKYVDLGLPSGTLWATCNIGANTPEEYGDYFAWGETTGYNDGKRDFDYDHYKWCNGSVFSLTKYCTSSEYGAVDNAIELWKEDDAANFVWGGNWRTPTDAQIEELMNGCDSEWTTLNEVVGRRFTSRKNGNSIFLPAAGKYDGNTLKDAGSCGIYSSRTLIGDCSTSIALKFASNYVKDVHGSLTDAGWRDRADGASIRPVIVPEKQKEHQYVDLGLPSGTLWATCNVGANHSEDFGDYFAWGEVIGYNDGKNSFDYGNYKWSYGSGGFAKYKRDVDNQYVLLLEDDAASISWGGDWRMPSRQQIYELLVQCTFETITQNGVKGAKVTSNINGNAIFLPATHYRNGTSVMSNYDDGYYWSRSLDDDAGDDYTDEKAYELRCFGNSFSEYRYLGLSVRPVKVK